MEEITTKRLKILPNLVDKYQNDVLELSRAYGEMLNNCREYPDQYLWYISWKLCKRENDAVIGYVGFKGLGNEACVEIGYGVDEEYEGKGYATEGVKGFCQWAFSTNQVVFIEAETELDNIASQRVLQKNSFTATGKTAIQNNITYLRRNGYIDRIGSNKNGYWKVL